MTGAEITSIVLGSGLLSGVVTTLLTQIHQRKEKRYDPRREAYAALLAALGSFQRHAAQLRLSRSRGELQLLFSEMLDKGSPLDNPLAQVRLLAPEKTVKVATNAVIVHGKYFRAELDEAELVDALIELETSMRKDLGSVA